MKVRILIGCALLILGSGLPLAAFHKRGLPWGFRGHEAVLLEVAGDVEISASEARIKREGLEEAALRETPGMWLEAGDVVRAGRFSEARLRVPSGEIALRDGSRATMQGGHLLFGRGQAELRVDPAKSPLVVEAVETGAVVSVDTGVVRVVADGKGTFIANVLDGAVHASTSDESKDVGKGMMLVVTHEGKLVERPLPTAMNLVAACESGQPARVKGKADPGTQIFMMGQLLYPEPADGAFAMDVLVGMEQVDLFARDAAGNTVLQPLSCAAQSAPKKK